MTLPLMTSPLLEICEKKDGDRDRFSTLKNFIVDKYIR